MWHTGGLYVANKDSIEVYIFIYSKIAPFNGFLQFCSMHYYITFNSALRQIAGKHMEWNNNTLGEFVIIPPAAKWIIWPEFFVMDTA